MKNRDYRQSVVEWAVACLAGDEGKTRAAVERVSAGHPIVEIARQFRLSPLDRKLLDLAYAVERSLDVAKAVRTVGGGRGLTVEVARSVLADDGVDLALAWRTPLRWHGLLVTDDAVCGASEIRLGPGLAARLDGDMDLESLAPGVRLIAPPIDGTSWIERHPPSVRGAELVKESLAPETAARLVTVDGCTPREAVGIGVDLVRRLGRAAIVVDGEAIASLAQPWAMLAAVRREADLDGRVLLVFQSGCLGGAWRALAAPPPVDPKQPLLVVLADADRPREVTMVEGLRHQAIVLYLPVSAAVAPAAATTEEKKTPPKDDAYEQIRQQAARDADAAMGIPRRAEMRTPPPARPTVAPSAPPAPVAVAATAPSLAPTSAMAISTAAPVAAQAAGPPAAAPTADAKPRGRRSKKAIEHFGPDPEDVGPPPRPAPAPVAAAAAAVPPAPMTPGPGPVDGPYLALSENPTPEELARVATVSPSAAQRVELMARLDGIRSSAVVASLRANARSENVVVRTAAETAMAKLFGPNWNLARTIPKPVQPPHTDDKDRGPPGGW